MPFDEVTAEGCCLSGDATDLNDDLRGLEGDSTRGEAAILCEVSVSLSSSHRTEREVMARRKGSPEQKVWVCWVALAFGSVVVGIKMWYVEGIV